MEFKVNYFRIKNGDTLKELAAKINMDVSNLSKVERGVVKPTITQLVNISKVYQIPLEDLIDTGEEVEPKKLKVNLNQKEVLEHYNIHVNHQPITFEELYNMKQSVYNLRELKETARIKVPVDRINERNRFQITLDGEEITEGEMVFAKQCIRSLRSAMNPKQEVTVKETAKEPVTLKVI